MCGLILWQWRQEVQARQATNPEWYLGLQIKCFNSQGNSHQPSITTTTPHKKLCKKATSFRLAALQRSHDVGWPSTDQQHSSTHVILLLLYNISIYLSIVTVRKSKESWPKRQTLICKRFSRKADARWALLTKFFSYTAGTPNGQKINITLEELGLNYTVHKIDIAKNVQKQEWFLKINRTFLTQPSPTTPSVQVPLYAFNIQNFLGSHHTLPLQ